MILLLWHSVFEEKRRYQSYCCTDKLHFICVDRRRVDPVSGQLYIQLENGKEILLPPNVHSVPCLLLTKENYRVLYGSDIVERFQTKIEKDKEAATQGSLGGNVGVTSECFTYFHIFLIFFFFFFFLFLFLISFSYFFFLFFFLIFF